jgi:DNA-binding GntR family transcriptional regulator
MARPGESRLHLVDEPEDRLELPASRSRWLAETLRARLLSGVYRPGTWIREATIRAEFGVSNGPVREAFQELMADKLLERVPYRGFRVVELAASDVVELFQLRSAMMELAAELAARRRDPVAIALVPEILAYVEWSSQASRPLTGAFTTWVAEASGNARLAQAWHDLYLQTQLYVTETRTSQLSFALSLSHIKALIGAIADGDAAAAREHARAFTGAQVAALGLDIAL